MRLPFHLLKLSTIRAEPYMAAMAAIAAGMFVGAWVIGPAVTRDSPGTPAPAARDRPSFEDMVARPDPSPYRTATPAFDMAAPNYAAAAKEKAQAETGGRTADAEFTPDTPSPSRAASHYDRAFDRHRVY